MDINGPDAKLLQAPLFCIIIIMAEGVGIGLGILEVLNTKIESNNLLFIVIVISVVQIVLYLMFLHIRDNIYRKVLLDWVDRHDSILRDQFFQNNSIHAIVEERTLSLTTKLDRVIYALVFLSLLFGGIQFLLYQRLFHTPIVEYSWEKIVDHAYSLKVNKLKENISQLKISTENICIVTQDESCGATVLLDNAMKELAELEKYSGKNLLLPGEIFRLLSIEGNSIRSALQTENYERKSEDLSIRSSLASETLARQQDFDSIRTGPGTLRVGDNWILSEEGDASQSVLSIRRSSQKYTGPDTRLTLHADIGSHIHLRGGALYINNTNILSTIQSETLERQAEDTTLSSTLDSIQKSIPFFSRFQGNKWFVSDGSSNEKNIWELQTSGSPRSRRSLAFS